MSDVNFTLFDGHLISVVLSVSNLASYPAMQAVYAFLLLVVRCVWASSAGSGT